MESTDTNLQAPLESWISLAHDLLNFEWNQTVQVFKNRNSDDPLAEYFSSWAEPKQGINLFSNLPVERLLDAFDTDQLVRVIELLLQERKIVFVTEETGRVALLIECLFSFLFPL